MAILRHKIVQDLEMHVATSIRQPTHLPTPVDRKVTEACKSSGGPGLTPLLIEFRQSRALNRSDGIIQHLSLRKEETLFNSTVSV